MYSIVCTCIIYIYLVYISSKKDVLFHVPITTERPPLKFDNSKCTFFSVNDLNEFVLFYCGEVTISLKHWSQSTDGDGKKSHARLSLTQTCNHLFASITRNAETPQICIVVKAIV